MRHILTLVFLLSFFGYGQYTLIGTVTDEAGHPVPGARVAVENSTYGVPTNMKGNYFLEFSEKEKIVVRVSMIGFEAKSDTIILLKRETELNFVLKEQSTSLNTVEIYADKKDIAKEVMKATIDNKKNMRRSYETYKCNTYIKTSLEKEPRFTGLLSQGQGEEEQPGRTKMNFIESYSLTKYKRQNTYKEEILAHHDYAEKGNSSVVVSANFNDPNSILPSQVISYNPYIFFEKVEDGDFDPYQNLIDLPKVSSRPLVSPVAANAFVNYKFTFGSIFIEEGQKIYHINVEPRFNEAPLFSGSLYIIDSIWVIKSMDLSVNGAAMEFFKDFRIVQDYVKVEGNWVPERREFIYTINDGMDVVMANTRVDHSNYVFDEEYTSRDFKNVVMEYAEDAFDKDSAYWVNTRPISLKPEELAFIHEQDSIASVLESDEYIDSVNAEFNRVTFWDVILSGVGFRSRKHQTEFWFCGLMQQPQLFGVGGYRHKLTASFSKEFKNAHKLAINRAFLDYGVGNNDFKGSLELDYTYLPKHFGSLRVRGGDIYDYINTFESITNVFSRRNMVRKTFFGLSQRYEIVNGLYGRLSFDYSIRRSIDNLSQNVWVDSVFSFLNVDNDPEPFETYTVSIFELELLYRFNQKYVMKGGKKMVIGTKFPEIMFRYKQGVPGLFGSDVNFSHVEIGASDEIEVGTFGNFKWRANGGSFFGKDLDNIRILEHKWFRSSDRLFFSNPLRSLQTLDIADTNLVTHTAKPYLEAYAIHHFNGALLSKVPLINKLKLEIVTGGGLMYIQDAFIDDGSDFLHAEIYFGLERKIKIKRQLFKIGTYYVLRGDTKGGFAGVKDDPLFGFKIGMDFFNSWTNSWSY